MENIVTSKKNTDSFDIKKTRRCPLCSSEIMLKAKICKYCKGDLSSEFLKGLAWRQRPASKGQITILNVLGIAVDNTISAGLASDLLTNAHEQDPEKFMKAIQTLEPKDIKKTNVLSSLIRILILSILLIIVFTIYHLKLYEKFLTDIFLKSYAFITKLKKETCPSTVFQQHAKLESKDIVVENKSIEESSQDQKNIIKLEENKTQTEQHSDSAADYFSRIFQPPEIGQKIVIQFANKSVMEGILVEIHNDGIIFSTDKATFKIPKQEIAPISQAMLYREAFVNYMLAFYNKHRFNNIKESSLQQSGNMDTKITKENKISQSDVEEPSPEEKARDAQKIARGEMSYKEWVEKYGKYNRMLLERQIRIKQYRSGL